MSVPRARSARPFSSRSTAITRAPAAARRTAQAAPIPLAAPVTIAVRPVRSVSEARGPVSAGVDMSHEVRAAVVPPVCVPATHLDRVPMGAPHGRAAETVRPGNAERPPRRAAVLASRATPTGLEPATSAVTGRRANQLRYGALGKTFTAYPQRDSNPCYRRERAGS